MLSNHLTEEERHLIDIKRKKALECRTRSVLTCVGSLNRADLGIRKVSNVTVASSDDSWNAINQSSTKCTTSQQWSISSRPLNNAKSVKSLTGKPLAVHKRPPAAFPDSASPALSVTCSLASRSTFEVSTRYHVGVNEVFKSLPSRKYDPTTRLWSFNLSDYNECVRKLRLVEAVRVEGLSRAALKIFKSAIGGKNDGENTSVTHNVNLKDYLPEDWVAALFPFQRVGVSIALSRGGRVLLADDMGLGKSVQALAVAAAYRQDWPLLIVSPSSVRFSWLEHCLRWLGPALGVTAAEILVVTSGQELEEESRFSGYRSVTVVSYDLMARHAKSLALGVPFGVVIMDESHFLKNNKTARTKAALPILNAAKRVLLLSGTPAVSRPAELYPQISAVSPHLFPGGFHEFGLRYCAAKECPWGWDYSGCSHMTELQIVLEESIMIRRIKEDVLSELPPKRRELVILDPGLIKTGRLKRHTKAISAGNLSHEERQSALLQYFHETSSAKLPALQQYVLDLVETDRKFILYAHHTEVLQALADLLETQSVRYIRIDGRTNSEQRSVVCRKFQEEDTCRAALLSITAAGIGLNLTAASLVVFAELYWNPGMLVQAEDRAYRIGQCDSVVVRYLLAEKTADDYIWPLIERKLQVLSKAGLNNENFKAANKTRLGDATTEQQQSILKYFESDLMSVDCEVDSPVDSKESAMFDHKGAPPAKRTAGGLPPEPARQYDCPTSTATGSFARVLVADTPDASPDKLACGGGGEDSTLDGRLESTLCTAAAADDQDTLGDDDQCLVAAALAAEVNWLTEGLLGEVDASQLFG